MQRINDSYLIDLQVISLDKDNLPSRQDFQKWVDSALSPFFQQAEITIRIVDSLESQQLNNTYRQKNSATNVLSFPFEAPIELDIPLLGDLIICKQIVEQEACEQHKPLWAHWAHMVIHGTLHLLGYDHITDNGAKEMETLETNIMQQLGFADPYQSEKYNINV